MLQKLGVFTCCNDRNVPNPGWAITCGLHTHSYSVLLNDLSATLNAPHHARVCSAGYCRDIDASFPPPTHAVHAVHSATAVSAFAPFSGSQGTPGHLRTTAASRSKANQQSATLPPPPLATPQSTPLPCTSHTQPRRRHSSSGNLPPTPSATKSSRAAANRTPRSTPRSATIPIRSTRASRGHSKGHPTGLATSANRFAPVATSARPHSTRGRASTGRITATKTASAAVRTAAPQHSSRSKHPGGHSRSAASVLCASASCNLQNLIFFK